MADEHADLIILGQAVGAKRRAAAVEREQRKRVAGEGATDARRGQRQSQMRANDQFLAVRLGELVAIMAADPRRARAFRRHDGNLDHRMIGQPVAIERDLGRVDAVLRIVEDDGGEAQPLAPLILAKRIPQPVEIVPLGRRTVGVADDEPHPRVARRERRGGKQRGGIVGIAADIEADRLAIPGAERVDQRVGQDIGLVPCGHENREDAAQPRPDRTARRTPGDAAPDPEPQAVEQQVVETHDEDADCREEHQFVADALHQPFDPCGRLIHRRTRPPAPTSISRRVHA